RRTWLQSTQPARAPRRGSARRRRPGRGDTAYPADRPTPRRSPPPGRTLVEVGAAPSQPLPRGRQIPARDLAASALPLGEPPGDERDRRRRVRDAERAQMLLRRDGVLVLAEEILQVARRGEEAAPAL